jgi:hypothetical protein
MAPRSRPAAVPAPEVRPFLENLAEILADAALRDLPRLRQEMIWRPAPGRVKRQLDALALFMLQ